MYQRASLGFCGFTSPKPRPSLRLHSRAWSRLLLRAESVIRPSVPLWNALYRGQVRHHESLGQGEQRPRNVADRQRLSHSSGAASVLGSYLKQGMNGIRGGHVLVRSLRGRSLSAEELRGLWVFWQEHNGRMGTGLAQGQNVYVTACMSVMMPPIFLRICCTRKRRNVGSISLSSPLYPPSSLDRHR
jgi:hypothetical protein